MVEIGMSGTGIGVVVAHGAWADGSSWARVVSPLLAEGHRVLAAPLPLTSFEADVAAVEQTLDRLPGPAVLVAHAYAGAVIAATRRRQVKALVYITALAPDEGETVADMFYRATPHPKAPQLAPDGHGLIYLPESAFAAAFAPHASQEQQALLAAVQRPIAVDCIKASMARPLWRDLPSWYLIAEQDYMILPETQRFMAHRMQARVHAHAVDHAPIVTAPAAVLEMIREAIASVRAD
jgi:hypothetical protein